MTYWSFTSSASVDNSISNFDGSTNLVNDYCDCWHFDGFVRRICIQNHSSCDGTDIKSFYSKFID